MNTERDIQADPDDAEGRALLHHLSACLMEVRRPHFREVAELLSGWLEIAGAGAPQQYLIGDIRSDARWWAELAHPLELEAYVGEGLRRIERTQFAPMARKRLFVALWETMDDADRRKFIQKVDPDGKFRKEKS